MQVHIARMVSVAALVAMGAMGIPACHTHIPPAPPSITFGAPESWIQTELFFGLTRRDGSLISMEAWQKFVDRTITPEFPVGFTVLGAQGQYLDSVQVLHKEPSRVVLLLYPQNQSAGNEPKIRRIVAVYISEFDQEAIIRTDTPNRHR